MKRSTIEDKHKIKLKNVKTQADEIEYLLDVAHVLDAYGESDTIVANENQRTEFINQYVNVVGTQNKGALYNEFLNIVENIPAQNIEQVDSYICTKCNVSKVAIQNDSYMICPECGVSDLYFDSGTQGMSYDQEINSEINTSFAYKRINHFNEWLAQFQAKESTCIPTEIIDKLKLELRKSRITKPSEVTYERMKTYLKKLNYNKYYEHIPHIINLINGTSPPRMSQGLEEILRNMFRDIQEPFDKHKPKSRSNFLSYSYCLYKFCELLEKDEFLVCFPLLKSREKLHQQDCIWKNICKEMNWEFIATV